MNRVHIFGRRPEDELAERIAEDMFGHGPEQRVRELRETILGPQPSPKLTGLLRALEDER